MTELMEVASNSGDSPAKLSENPAPIPTCSVFSCAQCRSIVADSTALVDMHEKFGLIFFNQASNVLIDSDKPIMSKEGFDAMTVFFEVLCSECRSILGRRYFCTPASLDSYRNLVTLSTKSLSIYSIGSQEQAVKLGDSDSGPMLFSIQDAKCQYERLSEIIVILLERLDSIEQTLQYQQR